MNRFLTALIAVLISFSARAEISPDSYSRLRAAAQESLSLEILKIKTKEFEKGKKRVFATAKVVSVQRSANQVKAGDVITLEYVHTDYSQLPGFAGPSSVAILKVGKVYRGYLNRVGRSSYAPAAYGQSFVLNE